MPSGVGLQRAPYIDQVDREYHVRFAQQLLTPLGRLQRMVRHKVEPASEVNHRRVQAFGERLQRVGSLGRASDRVGQDHRPPTV
jgi:hypothetical protein